MRPLPPTAPLAVAAMLLAATGAVAPAARAQQPVWAPIPSSASLPGLGQVVYDRARHRLVALDRFATVECDRAVWRAAGPGVGVQQTTAAFDSLRNVTVSFGGFAAAIDNSTREWDGSSWTLRTPANIPPGRGRAAMAFDLLRARIVLFGGVDPGGQRTNDTFEYDGTTWSLIAVPTAPPPRDFHVMTFDPVRGVTLLFGGNGNTSGLADTWEYNGTAWTPHAGGPPGVIQGGLAYDEVRARAVLLTGGGASLSTWERIGTTWSLIEPAGPLRVALSGTAFDPILGRIVAVLVDAGSTSDIHWSWTGSTWEPVRAIETPPLIDHMAMAFSPSTRSTLAYGGGSPPSLMDRTWQWRGGVWRRLQPANNPPALGDSALAADVTGDVLLFGGRTGTGVFGGTFRFTGGNWQQLAPANAPPPRSLHGMASDSARGRVVLFGGATAAGTVLGDTWEWDGVNWTGLLPALSPAPRTNPALAFDGAAARTLLFGGVQSGAVSNDFWQWDGVNWQQIVAAFRPTARGQGQLAFDPHRNRTVLAAGFTLSLLGPGLATGTFEWDGTAWTAIAGTQPPPSLPSTRGVFDATAARFVLHNVWLIGGGTTWEFGKPSLAAAVPAGAPCAGSAGALQVAALGLPRLGNPFFAVRLSSALPGALAALGLAPQPAAIALGGGCTLLLSAPMVTFAIAGAAGAVDFALPLPAVPALHGATVHCQGAAMDAQGPWLGLAGFSGGLQLTLD